MEDEIEHPRTVKAAVERLLEVVPKASLQQISQMTEDDLSGMHLGLGMWIRNNFGLWGANAELIADTGEDHADNASGVILYALWQRLRNDG